MPVERTIYKTPFHKESQPQWTCPACGRGVLEGIKGSFHYGEVKESIDAQEKYKDTWDPDQIVFTYSTCLRCTNPQCKEIIASAGTGGVDFEPVYDEATGEPNAQDFYNYFLPKYFWPHLNIFNVPKNTPEPIREEINKSFELFFASPSSSSNHIRIALENLLDHLKVKRTELRNKKRVYISLHRRVLLLPQAYSDLKDLLIAIKWLGNTGSHTPVITMDDVMDAYDILEMVINELFEKRASGIKKLAKRINKRKGPQRGIIS